MSQSQGSRPSFEEEVMHLLRKMDTRLGNVESRLDDLTTRMECVETRMERVETRSERVETQMERVEADQGSLAPGPVPPDSDWSTYLSTNSGAIWCKIWERWSLWNTDNKERTSTQRKWRSLPKSPWESDIDSIEWSWPVPSRRFDWLGLV